jgi:hypothetical protein
MEVVDLERRRESGAHARLRGRLTGPTVLGMRSAWRSRAAVGALLLAGALAACGDSDEAESGSGAETATPARTETANETATPTAEPTPDTTEDKRIAEESVLTLDDFPSGWTAADDTSSSPAQCDAVKDAKAAASARANSPEFASGETTQVTNSVYMFADESAAEEAFSGLSSKDTRLCFGRTVSEGVADQGEVEVGDAKTAELSVDPLGDERSASRITLPLSAEGVDVDLVIDLVFVRIGRAVSLNLFVDTFTAFDEDLRGDLTASSVKRLTAEL